MKKCEKMQRMKGSSLYTRQTKCDKLYLGYIYTRDIASDRNSFLPVSKVGKLLGWTYGAPFALLRCCCSNLLPAKYPSFLLSQNVITPLCWPFHKLSSVSLSCGFNFKNCAAFLVGAHFVNYPVGLCNMTLM